MPWKDNHRSTLLLLGFDEDLVDTVLEVRRKSEEEMKRRDDKIGRGNMTVVNKQIAGMIVSNKIY